MLAVKEWHKEITTAPSCAINSRVAELTMSPHPVVFASQISGANNLLYSKQHGGVWQVIT